MSAKLSAAVGRGKSGSLIGVCSAVGALGGVGINLALRESYLTTGTETVSVLGVLALPMSSRRP